MEENLVAILTSIAGGRVSWGRAPQEETRKPYVVLTRIDGIRDYVMGGAGGYVESRVQIDVYGETYTSTKQTARAVIAALSGHSDDDFQGIFVDDERDFDATDTGEATRLFRTSVDIFVHHTE